MFTLARPLQNPIASRPVAAPPVAHWTSENKLGSSAPTAISGPSKLGGSAPADIIAQPLNDQDVGAYQDVRNPNQHHLHSQVQFLRKPLAQSSAQHQTTPIDGWYHWYVLGLFTAGIALTGSAIAIRSSCLFQEEQETRSRLGIPIMTMNSEPLSVIQPVGSQFSVPQADRNSDTCTACKTSLAPEFVLNSVSSGSRTNPQPSQHILPAAVTMGWVEHAVEVRGGYTQALRSATKNRLRRHIPMMSMFTEQISFQDGLRTENIKNMMSKLVDEVPQANPLQLRSCRLNAGSFTVATHNLPLPRLCIFVRQRSSPVCMVGIDIIDPPEPPSVGGNVIVEPPTSFPSTLSALDQPPSVKSAPLPPLPDIASIIFAPIQGSDLVATAFLGVALMLGPDFLLAPAGLVSNEGIRPGFALESVIGEIITPDDQWLKDRKENLASSAPPIVRGVVLLPFLAAGLLVNRLLLVSLEDQSFVTSLGIIGCLGGGALDILREKKPTREERDFEAGIRDDFLVFSSKRLAVGGVCHETDILRAFRKFYPRYRMQDMSRTVDGIDLPDYIIKDTIRWWNRQMGRPAERSPAGYWKGISVVSEQAPGSAST